MTSYDLPAIDVHAHYGPYTNRPNKLLNEFMSAPASEVVRRAEGANIALTVVSPIQALMPRGRSDALSGNADAAQTVARWPALLQWVVIDPRKPETFRQAEARLADPRCAGIKLHPEEHLYPIKEFGRELFGFAARHRATVLIHSGEENSLPEDCVPFANDYPEMQLIVAHLGCGYDGDPTHQVRAIQANKHGNMYIDTSSAQSILPGLIEWAAREVGSERLLFGTDTPLYFSAMQRIRIDEAELSYEQKKNILQTNAARLLQLAERLERIAQTDGNEQISALKEKICHD